MGIHLKISFPMLLAGRGMRIQSLNTVKQLGTSFLRKYCLPFIAGIYIPDSSSLIYVLYLDAF